tara:strand:+ start:438 stop:2093 length:1656 start_codon:yes stop_codon:yes gene_type:complete
MNDIELAEAISPEIGLHYKSGRSNCQVLPLHSLVCFRSLASVICDEFGVPLGLGNSLDARIEALLSAAELGKPDIYRLRELRNNGNLGAHPEDSPQTDFLRLAQASDKAAQALIKSVYALRVGPVPRDLVTVDVATDELQRIGYQATFDRDVDSMYRAGLYLQSRATSASQTGSGAIRSDGFLLSTAQDIDQAIFWFKHAAQAGHVEAMYQYGFYRSRNRIDVVDPLYAQQEGERFLFRAGEEGNADALYEVGNLYYDGSNLHDKDLVQAREYYERAAELNHPGALGQLGYMYSYGVGCEANLSTAAHFILRSAEAGFPQGQYNAAQIYFSGKGVNQEVDKALEWLERSVAQDYRLAQLQLAQLLVEDQVTAPDYDPMDLLQSSLQAPDLRPQALLTMAKLMFAEQSLKSWVLAANQIQEAYELALEEDQPSVQLDYCKKLGKEIAAKLRNVTPGKMADQDLEFAHLSACCLFDANGVPLPKRADFNDRLQELVGKLATNVPGASEQLGQFFLQRSCLRPGSTAKAQTTAPGSQSKRPKKPKRIKRKHARR